MIKKCRMFFGVLFVSIALLVTVPAKPAYACEQAFTAMAAIATLWNSTIGKIVKFVARARAFIKGNLLKAQFEMNKRMIEFDTNAREALGVDFWGQYLPAMKLQTAQLNVADVDQSRSMGSFVDAQSQTESQRDKKKREVEAHRRFRISDQSCQAESVKETLMETEELSSNISTALNIGERQRQGVRVGSISENGQEAEHNFLYEESRTNFCAPGQVGCTGAGANPMGHILNANFTNGEKMSYDMTQPENRILMNRVISNFTSPISPPAVPIGATIDTATKREILFKREPLMARKSLLNYIMGKQIGAAVAGNANLSARATRMGSNINPANASDTPSKREIKETMRERILSNAFIMGTLVEPEDLLRRQATMKEQQMRTWIQIKDVNEDRLLLLALLLGQDLSEERADGAPQTRRKRR